MQPSTKRGLVIAGVAVLLTGMVSVAWAAPTPTPSPSVSATTPAPATTAPGATTGPSVGGTAINPPVAPAPIPTATATTFDSSPNSVVFKGAVKGNASAGAWGTITDDNTLVNLGHSVALIFKANGGTVACSGISPVLWGVAPNTNACTDALSKTVLYLNKTAIDDGLSVTYDQNVYFANVSMAIYLT